MKVRLIDTLRTKIKNFASTVSLSVNSKIVILDENRLYFETDSVQPALRNFIEEFSSNCRFIFTCNYKNRIIPALHSRCTVVDFNISPKQKQRLASNFHKRLCDICDSENIKYDDKILVELIIKFFPDFRRCLNEVQRYNVSNEIDTNLLATLSEEKLTPLIDMLQDKKLVQNMRKWFNSKFRSRLQFSI